MSERVKNKMTLFDERDESKCPNAPFTCMMGTWRCVVCTGDRDIFECNRCGAQKEGACNFDEDFS